ncbi:hypothetical protein GCM10010276_86290 [Streptomyces longisporus]|uniref:Uncharacterized protein n=1 Tax=Streptomyces longisporus TaxID=1948 RepID=A0ABN3NH69_STRLO
MRRCASSAAGISTRCYLRSLGLAGMAAVGIPHTTLIAVKERIAKSCSDAPLEPASATSPGSFLTESAALGPLGQSAGTPIGTAVVVGVSFHIERPPGPRPPGPRRAP